MSVIVKITLVVALLLSIVIPFGAFAAGEKTKGRYKTALAVNLFLFFGTMVFAGAMMFSGNAYAAEAASGAASSAGMGYLSAALHRPVLSGRRNRRFRSCLRGFGSHQRGQHHSW